VPGPVQIGDGLVLTRPDHGTRRSASNDADGGAGAGPAGSANTARQHHDAHTLCALAAELPSGALLVLYLDGSAAEQAAVTAARRGVRVVAVAPARHKEWDRKLQDSWRQNVLES